MKLIVVLAMGLALFMPGAGVALGNAYFELDGDPYESGSWAQAFTLKQASSVTVIQAYAQSTASPATQFESIFVTAWTGGQYLVSSDLTKVAAKGASASGNLGFALSFGPDSMTKEANADFILHIQAYSGTTLVANVDYVWRNSNDIWNPNDVNNVKGLTGTWTQNAPLVNSSTAAEADGPYYYVSATNNLVLNGSSTDEFVRVPLVYAWDLDGDGYYDDGSGASYTVQNPVSFFQLPLGGSKTIGLQVYDGDFYATDTALVKYTLPVNTPDVVPEPVTMAGLMLGVCGLSRYFRKRWLA